ncbi:MAG: DUF6785 family protein [Planctomycetota bacterium]
MKESKGLTVRSFILGLIIISFVNIWVAYSEYIVHASRMNLSHFPLALFVVFLVTVAPVNFALKLFGRDRALSPSELMVIVAMGLVGAAVPASGLTGFFLGVIAAPFYFASPENKWGDHLHPYIPRWIAPRDDAGALRWFYEGLPPGAAIPWGEWIIPLFWWLVFIGAVVFLSACIAVILRKQWAENERLTYPLIAVTQEIVACSDEPGLLPAFMRGRLFWYGFLLSFGIIGWNILSYFSFGVPEIPVGGRWFRLGRDFPTIHTRLNFFTIGFAYFANPDVLFSIWVFFLIFILQAGVFNRIGFDIGEIEDQWSNYDAANSWQNFGAFFLFVLAGLWAGRKHIGDVARKAFNSRYDVDDTREMLSYRTAFFGLILSIGFILCWLRAGGMQFKLGIMFLLATVVIFIGVARIVAESGLIYVRGPLSAQSFGCYILGSGALAPSSLTMLAFTYTLIANGRALFMTGIIHSVRFGDLIRGSKKRLLAAVLLGLFVGTIVSIWITLYLGYQQGAYNFQDVPFSSLTQSIFNDTVRKMSSPFSTSWPRLLFFGIGFAGMGGLLFLRHAFPWWPLHPVGFAISCTYLVRRSVMSIFIAWCCKTVVLKIGGVSAYRKSKPFFLGLLTGYAFGVALSYVVDAIWFPGAGHEIHSW